MDRRQFLKLAGGTALGPTVSRFAGNGAGSVLASGPAALAHQSTARPNYGPDPAPGAGPAPVTRRLLVNINQPAFLPSQGNVKAQGPTLAGTIRTGWSPITSRTCNTQVSDIVNYVVAERHSG